MAKRRETWGERTLRKLLGSEARAKVIGWICSHPEQPIIGAELARELGLSATAVSRELARLEEIGMLEAGKLGRAKPYYLAETFPLLPGLRSMVMYATGIVAVLREQLADEEEIEVAFIFGSLAAGDDRPNSDVDLMVVGDIEGIRLSQLTWAARRTTGREINPIHYSRAEFAARLEDTEGFLGRVMRGAKVLVKGDEDALRRLAGAGEDTTVAVGSK